MSLRRFLVFDVLGMLAWIGVIVGLGYAVGHPAVQVAKAISHYALLSTVVVVVIAFAVGVLRARREAVRLAATARSGGPEDR
jgi:membrane protein DedA with SNARE-associated domain